MNMYRNELPQLSGDLFLTDGGIETTLIFHDGIDLPYFAAFDLFKTQEGTDKLHDYFLNYVEIAKANQVNFILESATWRASRDWAEKLDYNEKELHDANKKAIDLLVRIRNEHANEKSKMVISGCVGPRGDGYSPDNIMSAEEATHYHSDQINTFADTEADMITAITMNYVEEAQGISNAAMVAKTPVVISFTVETDGRLPTGQSLKDAIEQVDTDSGSYPSYYMINCAHPTHFENIVTTDPWAQRIRGLRANASKMSHAELDEAEELDDGNPEELAGQYAELKNNLTNLNIVGGCCGTDHRHVHEICRKLLGV